MRKSTLTWLKLDPSAVLRLSTFIYNNTPDNECKFRTCEDDIINIYLDGYVSLHFSLITGRTSVQDFTGELL